MFFGFGECLRDMCHWMVPLSMDPAAVRGPQLGKKPFMKC